MELGAIIDSSEKYRYLLTRSWDRNKPPAVFVMLNPSTADAEEDDLTIRRCIGFAKRWGLGGIKVVNVFAWRATDPKALIKAKDHVGPENGDYIRYVMDYAGIIIMAWGAAGPKSKTAYRAVFEAAQDAGKLHKLYCLGLTNSGSPRHPLYLKNTIMPKLLNCELSINGYKLKLSGEIYENRTY